MSTENLFNKRVYGCAIIKSINANYNADFTKQPRTLPNGIVYATDKALKYTSRHFLYKNYAHNLDSNSNSNNKILYYTRYKTLNEKGQFVPMSLREIYEYLFGEMEKVTKENKNPKWMIYYFDGEKIIGKLQKIKPADIKKYYEGLDDKPEYADLLEKIAKEANDKLKIEDSGMIKDIEMNIEEPYFFYVKKNDNKNKAEKINLDEELLNEELLESIINDLDLQFFGGYNKLKILYNLLNCLDVRLFGATFTGDTNVSIHGPVQINHAQDRFFYQGAIQNLSYTEQIKSPVRNDKAKGGDAEMTTIGSDSRTMEAHYVHNFSINPKNLSDHLKIANQLSNSEEKDKYPEVSGLSIDDINKLKESLRCGATFYDSTSKAGVENEMLLWVELIDGSKQVIPNFTELISITRDDEGKVEINLKKVQNLLQQSHIDSQIEKVSVYFNKTYANIILGDKTISEYEKYNNKWNFEPIELNESEKTNKNE
jgi:CRISPR/Cas system type I-B associated protein Csh2 (Cas7 group RAMP superfamily)